MPIATPTLRLPKTLPTTVGIVEKNPPFAAPLMITNAINGPRELLTGQSTSMLSAERRRAMNNVFTGPIQSDKNPHTNLPTADEKLNPATNPAPADGLNPKLFE
jgi:hypothetical protein